MKLPPRKMYVAVGKRDGDPGLPSDRKAAVADWIRNGGSPRGYWIIATYRLDYASLPYLTCPVKEENIDVASDPPRVFLRRCGGYLDPGKRRCWRHTPKRTP